MTLSSDDGCPLHCPDCIFVQKNFIPRQVRHSPTVGRYLVAARDIEPLELVLWDRWVANCLTIVPSVLFIVTLLCYSLVSLSSVTISINRHRRESGTRE